MNSIKSVINNFESFSDNDKVEILLYGDSHSDNNKNKYILEATLNYVKNSERFSGSLFEWNIYFFLPYIFSCEYFHTKASFIVLYYFLYYRFMTLFFNILFSPNKQNVVGALLYVFLFIFIFLEHHYYRKNIYIYFTDPQINYRDEAIIYYFIYSGARKVFRKIMQQLHVA